jgi:hypothetical protein
MTSSPMRLAPLALVLAVAAPRLATTQSSAAFLTQRQKTVRSMFALADINRVASQEGDDIQHLGEWRWHYQFEPPITA